MIRRLLLIIFLFAVGSFAYKRVGRPEPLPAHASSTSAEYAVERPHHAAAAVPPSFRCDGRVRCTQMTSCEEAMFFLQHCGGVKMDGDGDGVPCEQQWCGH